MPVISAWLFTAYFHLLKCPAPRVSPGHPICEAFCIWPLVTAQLPLFHPCSLSWTRLSGDSSQVPDGPQGLCTGSCPPCCFPQKLCGSLLWNLNLVKPLLSILWSHSFQERELTSEFKRENFMEKLLAKHGDLWTRQLEMGQWEHEGIRNRHCKKQLPSLGEMRKRLPRLQLRSWEWGLQNSGGCVPLGGLSELGGSDMGSGTREVTSQQCSCFSGLVGTWEDWLWSP